MTPLPTWFEELCVRLPGEKPYEHVCRMLRAFHGCSLVNDKPKLVTLFLINEPTWQAAQTTAERRTNCATAARCLLRACGCEHELAQRPYPGQIILDWLRTMARDCDALIDCRKSPDAWERIGPGDLLHYNTTGTNDNHVEIALGSPDLETGFCEHGGGGKAANGILVMPASDIRLSPLYKSKRPLVEIFRTDRLLPVDLFLCG